MRNGTDVPARPGLFGKLVRVTLGTAVVVAAAGAATHSMGLWQLDAEAEAPPAVRPVGAPVEVPGRTVTVLAAGSILPSLENVDQARRDGGGTPDFGPMLAGVRSAVSSADLALCHLGVPVAAPGGPVLGPPRYSAPQELARAIADTGFDGCATAAAHALDQGFDGVTRTVEALERAEVGHAGTYADADAAERPRLYRVDGIKVAHLSYALPRDDLKPLGKREWALRFASPERIETDARAARAAGAEIVVVSVEWGTYQEHEPDVDQQTLARKIARLRNVDVVFGHGAHVVQPAESINGKWIVYGLGDLLSRHPQPVNSNREGSMMRVTFAPAEQRDRWTVAAIEALPTFVDLNPAIRTVDLEQSLADPDVSPGHRRIHEAAVGRIESHLLNRGGGESVLQVRARGR